MWQWRGWAARPSQLAPSGDWWDIWLILSGRGFGKTRCLVEWVYENVDKYPRWAVFGRTASDVRDILIEGPSGFLNIGHPSLRPKYEPSKLRLTFPNGAIASLRTGEDPDAVRGLNVGAFIADELAAWKHPQETWDQFMFAFRAGEHPRGAIATTPKPIGLLKDLLKDVGDGSGTDEDKTVALTRRSTYDNIGNLAQTFIRNVVRKYEGTRLGRQELNAEVLEDVPGALWTIARIEKYRVRETEVPPLLRIAIGVDPEASSEEGAAETGIICGGVAANGHAYIFDDESIRDTPAGWGMVVVKLALRREADRVIGEVNNGGEMVGHVIATVEIDGKKVGRGIPYKPVRASRGKMTRAEPVSALYEQGRVHHVGPFPLLEEQMTTWIPGMTSPDRMDALVWLLTELLVDDDTFSGWTDYMRADRERMAEARGEADALEGVNHAKPLPQGDDTPAEAVVEVADDVSELSGVEAAQSDGIVKQRELSPYGKRPDKKPPSVFDRMGGRGW